MGADRYPRRTWKPRESILSWTDFRRRESWLKSSKWCQALAPQMHDPVAVRYWGSGQAIYSVCLRSRFVCSQSCRALLQRNRRWQWTESLNLSIPRQICEAEGDMSSMGTDAQASLREGGGRDTIWCGCIPVMVLPQNVLLRLTGINQLLLAASRAPNEQGKT